MATKKTQKSSDESLQLPGNDAELEQAIDDLRGVLKKGADSDLPDFGGDIGSDIAVGDAQNDGLELSAFGGNFGGDTSGFDAGGFGADSSFADTSFSGGESGTMQPPGSALTANLEMIMDIPIDVQIVLGSSRMQVSGLMNLNEGAIIALDKKIGEPVEITVNGRKIARGEITVLENDDTHFGVKLIEVLSTKKA
ncbi:MULTISPECIES: flagellar motor switch protein FliN [unclassified Sinorhizobium]|uniref:flagellar motor switch protein FliN n=1 Tax=unclassified Sinorhizobium TaxID=2613772 RepID=UPI003524CF03